MLLSRRLRSTYCSVSWIGYLISLLQSFALFFSISSLLNGWLQAPLDLASKRNAANQLAITSVLKRVLRIVYNSNIIWHFRRFNEQSTTVGFWHIFLIFFLLLILITACCILLRKQAPRNQKRQTKSFLTLTDRYGNGSVERLPGRCVWDPRYPFFAITRRTIPSDPSDESVRLSGRPSDPSDNRPRTPEQHCTVYADKPDDAVGETAATAHRMRCLRG